jgi:hypothetical protein
MVRPENVSTVLLYSLTSPWTGLFFSLFLVTTVLMSRGVTEDVRQQRTRILPVSFLMLFVATTVRSVPVCPLHSVNLVPL